MAPTGTIVHADAAQDGQSTTPGEREEACDLSAMQSDRMLRAKIRDLMASGILPRVQSDGSLVDEAGRSAPASATSAAEAYAGIREIERDLGGGVLCRRDSR